MTNTILITGGAGFIGSSLGVFLKQHDPDVRIIAVDNLKRRGSELNLARLKALDVEFHHADVRSLSDIDMIDDISVVVDCAADPSVLTGYSDSPKYIVDTNLGGTVNCLEIARRTGAAVIFLSTSRVYATHALNQIVISETATRFQLAPGQVITGVSPTGIDENFPTSAPRTLYGTTKFASEALLSEYLDMYDIKGVVNRCGVISGPWQMAKIDQGILGLWVAQHYFGGRLTYIGFGGLGKQVRDILHIQDLCVLIQQQIRDIDNINKCTFNVGGGVDNAVSLIELTRLCERATGNKLEIQSTTVNRPGDIPVYISNNSAVTGRLGWSPRIDVETLVVDYVAWIKENEKALRPILCE